MRGDLVEGTTRGSLPHGVRTELSRARIQPGLSDDADSWMQMLNDRRDECVARFARDRMAIEILFRERRDGEDFLYSVSIQGERGAPN